MIWRDEPPTPGECGDPTVIGWAFRGKFCNDAQAAAQERAAERAEPSYPPALLALRKPTQTTEHGVVVELLVMNDYGVPRWVRWRAYLFDFKDLQGRWCPIRVGDAP